MIKRIMAAGFAVLLLSGCSDGVYFKNLDDGDTVSSPFTVKMGVCSMDVQKAGDAVEGAGHHHLIINGGCVAKGETVLKNENYRHFGKGQIETLVSLQPGKHSLTLQFANGHHTSYGEGLCKTIHINVE